MKQFSILEFAGIDFPFFIHKGTHYDSYFPHTHDFVELEIIINGSANHIVEGKAYSLKRGDVIVMMPSYIHELQNVHELEHYNLKFDLEKLILLESDIEKLSGFQSLFVLQPFIQFYHEYTSHMHLDEDQLTYVKTLCELVYTEWLKKDEGYKWVVKPYFIALITFLSRNFSSNICINFPKMHRIAESISFIHENLSEKISVSMLSTIACLSERQYARVFKDAYGISPIEYVINCRLSLSCKMMKNTDKSMLDICYACGFGDKVSFSRLFKKRYNSTPSQYRKFFK